MKSVLTVVSAISVLLCGAHAEEENGVNEDAGPIIEAIKNGNPIIDVRYRFEIKEQDGFALNARSNTLRTRLGYDTGEFFNFKALVEFENVFTIGEDRFNSTTNGQTQFPVVADPDATEINRAQVTFTGIDKTPITIGRQRYNLNNHRFIGAVDFRQNQQTFDAARVSTKLIENLTLDYLYISRVHRIFGDDNPLGEYDSDSHVISAAYDAGALGVVKGYGVLLDLEQAPGLSSQSWGVRYENSFTLEEEAGAKFGIVWEYASQSDFVANPANFTEFYIHVEGALTYGPFSAKAGFEQLSGDGANRVTTPLATLHKFQGFADVFLVTPVEGLRDIYGTLGYNWAGGPFETSANFFATYHDFRSDVGSLDFGKEIDAGVNIKTRRHWSAQIKGSIYQGGRFVDRSLVWASLRFQY